MFEKLRIRIAKDLGLNLTNFERTRAGTHMKGSGAFVWVAKNSINNDIYGSSETATSLVKKKESLVILDEYGRSTQYEIS